MFYPVQYFCYKKYRYQYIIHRILKFQKYILFLCAYYARNSYKIVSLTKYNSHV